MSTMAATTTPRVRVVGQNGLGLISIALCLGGALLTLDRFNHGSLSPAAGVSWGVIWVVGTIASATALTSGTSVSTRAIDVRRASLVYFLISFGLMSLSWRHQQSGTAGIINRDSVPLALLISQAGITAWALGFRFLKLRLLGSFMANARHAAAPTGPWTLRSPYIPIALYMASAAATAYHLRAGTFAYLADANSLISSPGSYGPLLVFGDQLGKAAIVVAAIGVMTANRRQRLRAVAVFAVLTAAELGIGAFSGTKTPFILLAVAVAVPFFANRRRVSWRIVAASLAVLAIGTSFTGAYRVKLTESGGRLQGQQALDAFTATAVETLQPVSLGSSVVDGFGSLGPRLRQIDNVAVVLQRTPSEIPYAGPSDLLLDPVRQIVPRVLWPGKPAVTTALDFSRNYYDLPDNLVSASAVTVVGDFYRHGGILPVILGMAVLGSVVRLVDDHWHPYRDVRLAVLYVAIFLTLVNLEADVASLVISIPSAVLSGVIASKIAFRPAGSAS